MSPPDKPTTPPSYSTAVLARRLGVSIPTVQRWVDAGYLKAWKTRGGHRRIDAGSAERLLHARSTGAAMPDGSAEAPSAIVVDDNPDDRDLLVATLQAAWPGAVVHDFDNAIPALVAIGRHAPTVLVTDIVMPHMDGLELLRQLVALGTQRPRLILVVSADCDAAGRPRRALPEGVLFAPKPLDAPRIVDALRDALAGA